jgi:hypothetical protein
LVPADGLASGREGEVLTAVLTRRLMLLTVESTAVGESARALAGLGGSVATDCLRQKNPDPYGAAHCIPLVMTKSLGKVALKVTRLGMP